MMSARQGRLQIKFHTGVYAFFASQDLSREHQALPG